MKHKSPTLKPVSVLIPNGVNSLENCLSGTKLSADRMKLILHQFCLSKLMNLSTSTWKKSNGQNQRWASLHSKILTKAGTVQYPKYISWLMENNIIELKKNSNGTKNYSPNGRSQQFRFCPEILISINGSFFHRETIEDYKPVKAANELRKFFAERPIKNSSVALTDIHNKLIGMTGEIRFNLKRFEEIRYTKDFQQIISSDKFEMLDEYHDLMEAFNSGEIKFATVDKFGERLHTQLTNLWSELRKFMYFNDFPNDTLVSLDFANSQPYFSSVCGSVKFVSEILPEFENFIPVIQNAKASEDFKSFETICADGSAYDFWAAARGIAREKAKKEIMAQIMFGKPKSTLAIIKSTRKIFGAHFPSVLKMFDQIKTMNADELPFIETLYLDDQNNFTGRKHLYKNLSCMMQRAESRIVIGKIAPALINAGLVPFVTIHDSFIVLQQHEEKVRKIIQEEFEKLEVHPPKVKATQLFVP